MPTFKEANRGFTIWMTGLSGSGKTTIAAELENQLLIIGHPVQRLDGDVLRNSLNSDLGFSKDDRMENIRRSVFLAQILNKHGINVIASFITPFEEMRTMARNKIPEYIEVYVDASLGVCVERDVKGLYALAMAGEITEFTGISSPYQAPENPDIVVKTDSLTLHQSAALIMKYLVENEKL